MQFIYGDADQLAHIVTDVNLVCLCNAIHLIPHKPAAIHKIMSTLAPGGYFACNTTVFTGAQTPEGKHFAHPGSARPSAGFDAIIQNHTRPAEARSHSSPSCLRTSTSISGDPGLAGA